MDNSSFIFGVDLDGVAGDFYSAMRQIAAEWIHPSYALRGPPFHKRAGLRAALEEHTLD